MSMHCIHYFFLLYPPKQSKFCLVQRAIFETSGLLFVRLQQKGSNSHRSILPNQTVSVDNKFTTQLTDFLSATHRSVQLSFKQLVAWNEHTFPIFHFQISPIIIDVWTNTWMSKRYLLKWRRFSCYLNKQTHKKNFIVEEKRLLSNR
jgi:hypothetical protein